jgi:hypothetical protein
MKRSRTLGTSSGLCLKFCKIQLSTTITATEISNASGRHHVTGRKRALVQEGTDYGFVSAMDCRRLGHEFAHGHVIIQADG